MQTDLDFLSKFNCNPALYNYVHSCKMHLKLRLKDYPVEKIHLETSVKTAQSVKTWQSGRFTIPLPLDEFLAYTAEEQATLFRAVGFNRHDFTLKTGTSSDIIFGFDGEKGKLYFDRLDEPQDPHIVCYEAQGKIKYYRYQPGSQTRLNVTDASGKKIGIHIRINGEENVYWYGINKEGFTFYIRP